MDQMDQAHSHSQMDQLPLSQEQVEVKQERDDQLVPPPTPAQAKLLRGLMPPPSQFPPAQPGTSQFPPAQPGPSQPAAAGEIDLEAVLTEGTCRPELCTPPPEAGNCQIHTMSQLFQKMGEIEKRLYFTDQNRTKQHKEMMDSWEQKQKELHEAQNEVLTTMLTQLNTNQQQMQTHLDKLKEEMLEVYKVLEAQRLQMTHLGALKESLNWLTNHLDNTLHSLDEKSINLEDITTKTRDIHSTLVTIDATLIQPIHEGVMQQVKQHEKMTKQQDTMIQRVAGLTECVQMIPDYGQTNKGLMNSVTKVDKTVESLTQKIEDLTLGLDKPVCRDKDHELLPALLQFQQENTDLRYQLEPQKYFREHLTSLDRQLKHDLGPYPLDVEVAWDLENAELRSQPVWMRFCAHMNRISEDNLLEMYKTPHLYLRSFSAEGANIRQLETEAEVAQCLMEEFVNLVGRTHPLLFLTGRRVAETNNTAFRKFKVALAIQIRRGLIQLKDLIQWLVSVWRITDCKAVQYKPITEAVARDKMIVTMLILLTRDWKNQDPKQKIAYHLSYRKQGERAVLYREGNSILQNNCECCFHQEYPLGPSAMIPVPDGTWMMAEMRRGDVAEVKKQYIATILHHIMYKAHGLTHENMPMHIADVFHDCSIRRFSFSDGEVMNFASRILTKHPSWSQDKIKTQLKRLANIKTHYCPCDNHTEERALHGHTGSTRPNFRMTKNMLKKLERDISERTMVDRRTLKRTAQQREEEEATQQGTEGEEEHTVSTSEMPQFLVPSTQPPLTAIEMEDLKEALEKAKEAALRLQEAHRDQEPRLATTGEILFSSSSRDRDKDMDMDIPTTTTSNLDPPMDTSQNPVTSTLPPIYPDTQVDPKPAPNPSGPTESFLITSNTGTIISTMVRDTGYDPLFETQTFTFKKVPTQISTTREEKPAPKKRKSQPMTVSEMLAARKKPPQVEAEEPTTTVREDIPKQD